MAYSSAQRKRVKTIGLKNKKRPSELDGWISDGEVQSKFLDYWKMRNLGLKKFVEMADPWYSELVKVFSCNLKINEGTLYSKVKWVDIKLTEEVWVDIAGLKMEGEKCHLGIDGFHKFSIYQECLRNPNDIQYYSHYKTGGMKKDDKLVVFIISWILLPRGGNHAQATTEDLLLLKALKDNIQVDWPAAISENMLKVTRLESTKLPYCVFISKILVHFGINCIDE
ncbi:hypothetical protein LR48_Vigan10g071800 [Vigna angularis]|uniref:Aminotransferase-like plant mobile domain-containing protein n=1 Tax=Phaseolus angularis TaxID=3914 RepID=A0A0L9VID7_PHAAN|nr:hypothetical protein LR48_Vigan10g071800 [Vigna angularis]